MKLPTCKCGSLFSFARLFIVSGLLKIRCEASCVSGSVVAVVEIQFQFFILKPLILKVDTISLKYCIPGAKYPDISIILNQPRLTIPLNILVN